MVMLSRLCAPVAAAALLAVLVANPASAAGPSSTPEATGLSSVACSTGMIATLAALNVELAGGGTIALGGDIGEDTPETTPVEVVPGKPATIDLCGRTLSVQPSAAGKAAVHVPVGADFTIIDSVGGGLLRAVAYDLGNSLERGSAGIGSDYGESAGTITILSGTVEAVGASYGGAGIGGGRGEYQNSTLGNVGAITIAGGRVNATGGSYGAGIGGGRFSQTGQVTITGGVVTAIGGNHGTTGIGGGTNGTIDAVTITGGEVIARRAPLQPHDAGNLGTGSTSSSGAITALIGGTLPAGATLPATSNGPADTAGAASLALTPGQSLIAVSADSNEFRYLTVTAIRAVPSAATPKVGHTITVQAYALGAEGGDFIDISDVVTLSSDTAGDATSGNTITFGDAGSRSITVSYGTVTTSFAVDVAEAPNPSVGTLTELQAALDYCVPSPNVITLLADILAPSTSLTTGCDTTIDLGAHDLAVRNIVIGTGTTLEITGPTDGSEGTLTVDASGVPGVAGIGNAGATFKVAGGAVHAIGGQDGAAIGGHQGQDAGAFIVQDGTVHVESAAEHAAAIGGGSGSGNGGAVTIGSAATVIANSPQNAIGGGFDALDSAGRGLFGQVQVDGALILPGGSLKVDDDPSVGNEIIVGATGRVLGSPADRAVGATITGTGTINNQGVIALSPDASMVTGNNRLITFDTSDPDIRVFAPSFDTGYRALPAPPAGTAWNTAPDGTGVWFTNTTSTAGSGATALHAVAPATLDIATDPRDLTAIAGQPYVFPLTVSGSTGAPLNPQPAVSYTSSDCTIIGANVFEVAGSCTIKATATVHGAEVTADFTIEVVAGPVHELALASSAAQVAQGGSLTFAVTGRDVFGNSADTAAAILSSSVPTDRVDGRTVTFPHASPHTITASLNGVTAQLTIEVIPARAGTTKDAGTIRALLSTGTDSGAALWVVAGVLLVAGALAIVLVRRSPAER